VGRGNVNIQAATYVSNEERYLILSSSCITADYSKEAAKEAVMKKLKELKRDMDRWLSVPDPSNTHNQLQEEHHEGTGTWFFETEDFRTWRDTPGSMLWIKGIRESTYCTISYLTLT
jgi:hypothetical protein